MLEESIMARQTASVAGAAGGSNSAGTSATSGGNSSAPCNGNRGVDNSSGDGAADGPPVPISNSSRTPSDILNSTPLSSLPSSRSLMRHLFELRKRQQEQRQRLEMSIQTASPNFADDKESCTVNEKQPSKSSTKENSMNSPLEVNAIACPSFSTSTPQHASPTSVSSSPSLEKSSRVRSSVTDTILRRALSRLPVNSSCVVNNSVPKYSAGDDRDENSPPVSQVRDTDLYPVAVTKPYNPNVYLSPPRKGRTQYGNDSEVKTIKERSGVGGDTRESSATNGSRASSDPANLDQRPISACPKSFEELILEQLKEGRYRSSPTDTPAPKKKFLAKGAGTARFVSPQGSGAAQSSQNNVPLISPELPGGKPKVKFPYLKKNSGTRRFNCGTVKLRKCKTVQQNAPVETLTLTEPYNINFSTPTDERKHSQPTDDFKYDDVSSVNALSPIFRKYPRREMEELRAFEKLEELAENTSFSSNASTVNSLLQKGLESSLSSTPINSPLPCRGRVACTVGQQVLGRSQPEKGSLPAAADSGQLTAGRGVAVHNYSPLLPPPASINYDDIESLAHEVAGVPYTKQRNRLQQSAAGLPEETNNIHVDKKKRSVQFCEQGAQIMEYCVSDCEDTASEVPTISDTSELLNASDLEALNQIHLEGRGSGLLVSAQYVDGTHSDVRGCEDTFQDGTMVTGVEEGISAGFTSYENCDNGSPLPSSPDRPAGVSEQMSRGQQPPPRHTVLQFSPPRIPYDAPSYPVWDAFGRNPSAAVSGGRGKKPGVLLPKSGGGSAVPVSVHRGPAQNPVVGGQQLKQLQEPPPVPNVKRKQDEELEAHKVLLVSKVHELEREISTFQTENAQLTKLKETLQREKEQLRKERTMFDITLAEDRKRMEEYFEAEKNKLWREKCLLDSNKPTKEQKSNTLEVINLKEEILLLKKELEKRDSMHNFTQNKLKERIKELDHQKKDFEKKVERLCVVEKENIALKHQVDRLKLSSRLSQQKNTKQSAVEQQPVRTGHPNKFVRFAAQAARTKLINEGKFDKNKNQSAGESSGNFSGATIQKNNNSSATSSPVTYQQSGPGSNGTPRNDDVTGINVSSVRSTPDTAANGSTGMNNTSTNNVTNSSTSSLNCSEVTLADGSRVITYANGNKKQIFTSGCVIQEYYNGDRKESYPDRTVYVYADTGTRQTTYSTGDEELVFSDGQRETRRADGTVETVFSDGTRRRALQDGSEVCTSLDGTIVSTTPLGNKVFQFPSGQREVHGEGFKRREYPDGTVKIVYVDGTTETKYPNGRIRIKDELGNVLSDTKLGIDLKAA